MNYKLMLKVLGYILQIIAMTMLPPLIISIATRQHDMVAFLVSVCATALVGYGLTKIPIKKKVVKVKEGLAIVTLGWLFASVLVRCHSIYPAVSRPMLMHFLKPYPDLQPQEQLSLTTLKFCLWVYFFGVLLAIGLVVWVYW